MSEIEKIAAERKQGCIFVKSLGKITFFGKEDFLEFEKASNKDEKHEENLVPHGRHDKEVNRDDLLDVVLEEGSPGGGRWPAPADHVL